MKKFSFVILHYNTFSDTVKCIEYIKKLINYDKSQIIVVNNNSTDDSYQLLKNKYSLDEIYFINSEYNTGFAKGNNLGYSVAKHKFKSKFVICMNSDVYIQQDEFLLLIENEYKNSEFDLLGPAIFNLDGYNQNPVEYIHDTCKKINKTIMINNLRYIKTFFLLSKRKKNKVARNIVERDSISVPLHGSCVIASSNFINKHEYLFYPDTFLYGEEDIMYYMSSIHNEKLVYSSVLEVKHAEDASTNSSFGVNEARKKRFILKNSNKSLKILRNLMKKKS